MFKSPNLHVTHHHNPSVLPHPKDCVKSSHSHSAQSCLPHTHQVLLLSKKRTRKSFSPASVCLCSPSFRTSMGGTGMGTPLCSKPSRGILGSIIWGYRERLFSTKPFPAMNRIIFLFFQCIQAKQILSTLGG